MSDKPRVVIDTNLIVSAFISSAGTPSRLLGLWWEYGGVTLLTSIEFVSEVEDVLHRDYIKQNYRLSEQRIREFLTDLRQATEFVTPLPALPIHSRDPKDDKLLALALGGNADYLITGDDDLLTLRNEPAIGNLRIMSAATFLQEEL